MYGIKALKLTQEGNTLHSLGNLLIMLETICHRAYTFTEARLLTNTHRQKNSLLNKKMNWTKVKRSFYHCLYSSNQSSNTYNIRKCNIANHIFNAKRELLTSYGLQAEHCCLQPLQVHKQSWPMMKYATNSTLCAQPLIHKALLLMPAQVV